MNTRFRIMAVMIAALSLSVGTVNAQTIQVDVNPKGSLWPEGGASTVTIIDLTAIGVQPGMLIHLERVGAYSFFSNPCSDPIGYWQTAVFSTDSTFLGATASNRIPGAIDTGIDIAGHLPVGDFYVSKGTGTEEYNGIDIEVPAGAAYLFVGVGDSYYGDNQVHCTAGVYAIRITVLEQDADGDGVPDDEDICPGGDDNVDSDADGVPDACDLCPNDYYNDADEDGVCGNVDTCPGGDDTQDADGDGTPDFCDSCPNDPVNDVDVDGVCGDVDNCPVVSNSDQLDADSDGAGDACDPDDDNDQIPDIEDNCPYDANTDQADTDGDGAGDTCDSDDDNDGVLDAGDQCMPTPAGEVVNADGCAIGQLCPCAHPDGSDRWKNHGAYVSCVAHTAEDFVAGGLITDTEKGAIVSAAGESTCGHKDK